MPEAPGGSEHSAGPPINLSAAERDAPTEWLPSALDETLEALVIRIYLALVQHHAPSSSLLIAQGMEVQQVDRALSVLSSRGLVIIAPDGTIEVPSPDTALPAHAAELERRAREARASAYELSQMYFAARSGTRPVSADVRTLTSLDDLHGASAEIISASRERVRAFRAPSPRTEQIFAAPDHAQAQPSYGADGTELVMQAVFDNRVLDYPRALEVLALRASAGERCRFTANIPFSAVIVDDTAAVVDVSNIEESGNGSLLIRSRPVVRGMIELFEFFWELGTQVNLQVGRTVDERDTTILSMMAAGASDATIARRTGVSQRTVERRVAALIDRLNAGTRFQAGVQAARRGLI